MLLQWAGLDPIDWTSSSTFAFLGNINFSSALIGMFCAGLIPIFFQGVAQLQLINKLIYVPITVMISLFIVITSGSQQGVFMFVLSLVTYLVIVLARRSLRPSLIVFFVLVVQSSLLAVLMLMSSRTFLNGVIFQETMGFRADYWRAAISIIWKNPWGIGPDTYGDFYRQYRDLQATTTTNSDRISDSAHSVLLDISVSFGLLAGLAFILSISWLWLKSIRCLIRTDNVIDKSILMIWFSLYLSYSLVFQILELVFGSVSFLV